MNEIIIYTDGAWTDLGLNNKTCAGGWAGIIIFPDGKEMLVQGSEKNTTVNRMELKALSESLTVLLSSKLSMNNFENNKIKIKICSDSAYVINTIKTNTLLYWKMNCWRTRKNAQVKNVDLWKNVFDCIAVLKLAGNELVFEKIKSHSGNVYNNIVDDIAKRQMELMRIGLI